MFHKQILQNIIDNKGVPEAEIFPSKINCDKTEVIYFRWKCL